MRGEVSDIIGFSIITFFSVFLVLGITIFLVDIVILLVSSSNPKFVSNGKEISPSLYQLQEWKPSQNRTSLGFISIPRRLLEHEFISFHNTISGSSFVISNFGNSQYECKGTCSCSSSPRRVSVTLTRSLYLVLSTLTSTLAFKIASQTFHSHCESRFASTCSEISSEVTSCTEKEETESDSLTHVEYQCLGHCIPQKLRNKYTIQAQEDFFEKEYRCEDLQKAGVVKVKRVSSQGKKNRYPGLNYKARAKFAKEYLTKFCFKTSRRNFWNVFVNRETGQKVRSRRQFSACVGVGDSSYPVGEKKENWRMEHYSNVRCVSKDDLRKKRVG